MLGSRNANVAGFVGPTLENVLGTPGYNINACVLGSGYRNEEIILEMKRKYLPLFLFMLVRCFMIVIASLMPCMLPIND